MRRRTTPPTGGRGLRCSRRSRRSASCSRCASGTRRRRRCLTDMDVVEHLANLIRIDTTNPPGNETPAAEYLAEIFQNANIPPVLIGPEPRRKSVIARLHGDGSKPPLLLCAHTDVVPAEPESWTHPPFAGEIHDGYLWGRGAI